MICYLCGRVPILRCKDSNLSCGQHFCISCFNKKWKDQEEKKCPVCQKHLWYTEQSDLKERAFYDKMTFKCSRSGCNKLVLLNEYVEHIKSCTKEAMPCTFECGSRNLYTGRKQHLEHAEKDCERVLVKCRTCTTVMLKKYFEDH